MEGRHLRFKITETTSRSESHILAKRFPFCASVLSKTPRQPDDLTRAIFLCLQPYHFTRMDKNGTVRLRVAGKIFLPRVFLDYFAIFPENLSLIAIIACEVIVQSLASDGAPYARSSRLVLKRQRPPDGQASRPLSCGPSRGDDR